MNSTATSSLPPVEQAYRMPLGTANASAVSWGAIVAGAAAAVALSLILLILGVGLGLSSVSPWSYEGISATGFGVSTIIWLTVTQLLSSGLGGYLAGRLRTKWVDLHTDEIFFRDTAHGFLSWAVASLATATLLASVTGSIVSGGVKAGASMMGGMASTATLAAGGMAVATDGDVEMNDPVAYFVDSLFRRDGDSSQSGSASMPASDSGSGSPTGSTDGSAPAPSTSGNSSMSTQRSAQRSAPADERDLRRDIEEVSRIFSNLSRTEPLPPEDVKYVAQLVAQRTGLTQAEAEKRVTDIYARAQQRLDDIEMTAKDAADEARKTSAYAALWIFVSMLGGAFLASLMATLGGRLRNA